MEFDQIVNKIIIYSLAASSLFAVLELIGLMPQAISKWINRNRLSHTIETLKEFGIDSSSYRRRSYIQKIGKYFSSEDNSELSILNKFKIKEDVQVGSVNVVTSRGFYDLMSAQCSPVNSELLAKKLATMLRELPTKGVDVSFDYIVAPKASSPILAYELSKILDVPLVLHNNASKFTTNPQHFRALFDCVDVPRAGEKALIVDDSTTGGAKVDKLIKELRGFGITVEHMLVVFEPTIKNARTLLQGRDVSLHSIVRIDKSGNIKID